MEVKTNNNRKCRIKVNRCENVVLWMGKKKNGNFLKQNIVLTLPYIRFAHKNNMLKNNDIFFFTQNTVVYMNGGTCFCSQTLFAISKH